MRTDVNVATAVTSTTLMILIVFSGSTQGDSRLCGKRLTDTLMLVCMGRGFNWQVDVKRSAWPFMEKRGGSTDAGGQKRAHITPRGIVDECCKQSCSYDALESYCADRQGGPTATPGIAGLATLGRLSLSGMRRPSLSRTGLTRYTSLGRGIIALPSPMQPADNETSVQPEESTVNNESNLDNAHASSINTDPNRITAWKNQKFFFLPPPPS
ncbi:PREDICTED: insulin-like peptide [Priapulus caudatus]|uniref:Insulin-like peptide n=1 Tax=Priapulus caudatus TaxID=37621 RepID=A0ABM1E0P9_PRICU|nr:PREDICTED: insulin-like peptide [Priapulus caudatus]